MTTTLELLDALKASNGGASDYAIAKLLGITQQTVSQYRTRGVPMSDSMVIKACELVGIDPVLYVVRSHVERAKCDSEKSIWNDALSRLGGHAA